MKKGRPMRQLWPEKGDNLAIFQNTDPTVFLLFIFIFLTYCIKEGIKGNVFGHYTQKCWPMMRLRPKTGEPIARY